MKLLACSVSILQRFVAKTFVVCSILAVIGVGSRARAQYSPAPLWVYNGIDGPSGNAYSPNGKYFAIAGNGGVQVFLNSTKAIVGSYQTNTIGVSAVAFSPDSKTLAIGGEPYTESIAGVVELWDIASGTMKVELVAPSNINAVAFSPDGSLIAGGGYDYRANSGPTYQSVTLWSAKTGELQGNLPSAAWTVAALAFSPDGKTLADVGDGNTGLTELWNVSSMTLRTALVTSAPYMNSLAFSPEGDVLATGGSTSDRTSCTQLWNTTAGKLTATLNTSGSITQALVFSKDGDSLYVGTTDYTTYGGTLEVWSATTKKLINTLNKATQERVAGLSISPDGRSMLECGQQKPIQAGWTLGVCQIWSLPTGKVTSSINVDMLTNALSFAFSPDSKTMLVGGANYLPGTYNFSGWLGFWDSTTGALKSSVTSPDVISNIALSADGTTLVDIATSSNEWRLEVRDGGSGKIVRTLTSQTGNLTPSAVAISRDGTTMASAGAFGINTASFLQCWSVTTGKLLFDLSNTGNSSVNAVCFSPDGTKLAAAVSKMDGASQAGYVQVIDVSTGQVSANFYPNEYRVEQLSFSPDGSQLLMCGLEYIASENFALGESEIWNLADNTLASILPINAYETFFGPISYSPDAKLIYVSTATNILVFDATTHAAQTGLNVGAIYGGMAISPNGKYIGYSGVPEIGVLQSPVESITLSKSTVVGGATLTGMVTLTHPAPTGGQQVPLATNSPNIGIPAYVGVPAGSISHSFSVTTLAVALSQSVSISAQFGGFSQTALLNVEAPTIKSLSLSPSSVKGGAVATGTVQLSSPAPVGGLAVTVSSNSVSATAPGTVTVPQGETAVTFKVTTSSVTATTKVTISAALPTSSAKAIFTIR